MLNAPERLVTPRLGIAPWTDDDVDAFHAIWGDPEVIFWGASAEREASRAMLARVIARCAGRPWPVAWHAVTLRESGEVVGNVCLQPAPWDTTELEVGWHFRRSAWGHGYATEAARAVLEKAFEVLAPRRVVCAILPSNARSQRVAARLGFARYASDFPHGGLPHDLLEVRPQT
jgi:RimJ/RimL family protein N-acetyltransferase